MLLYLDRRGELVEPACPPRASARSMRPSRCWAATVGRRLLLPELLLLKGDLLAALEATGAAVGSDAGVRRIKRRSSGPATLGARMSELRRGNPARPIGAARVARARLHDLRSVYDTFTEGFTTADLVEARQAWTRRGPRPEGGFDVG